MLVYMEVFFFFNFHIFQFSQFHLSVQTRSSFKLKWNEDRYEWRKKNQQLFRSFIKIGILFASIAIAKGWWWWEQTCRKCERRDPLFTLSSFVKCFFFLWEWFKFFSISHSFFPFHSFSCFNLYFRNDKSSVSLHSVDLSLIKFNQNYSVPKFAFTAINNNGTLIIQISELKSYTTKNWCVISIKYVCMHV